MNILVVANHALSNHLGSGGDILICELAERWQKQGHTVHLLISQAGKEAFIERMHPQEVLTVHGSRLDSPRYYFDKPLRIALVYLLRSVRTIPILRTVRPDVIYTPGDFWCDILPASLLKLLRHKCVWAAAIFHINESPSKRHDTPFFIGALSWLAQRASFFLIKRLADVVFALNSDVRASLVKRGWLPEKLHVQGAGLDIKRFKVISEQQKQFTACYIGRINPTKGVFDLPRIWANVIKQVPNCTLIIIGKASPAWEKRLTHEIETAGVREYVQYAGFIPSQQMYTLLKESKIYISASTEEGFGMSIAEAMANGLPAVVYDLPAYREFFPGGMTRVPVGDIHAFADAIVQYITDTSLYDSQSKKARKTVRRYNWDHVAAAELQAIQRVRL